MGKAKWVKQEGSTDGARSNNGTTAVLKAKMPDINACFVAGPWGGIKSCLGGLGWEWAKLLGNVSLPGRHGGRKVQ